MQPLSSTLLLCKRLPTQFDTESLLQFTTGISKNKLTSDTYPYMQDSNFPLAKK